jgi:hypothetical protein
VFKASDVQVYFIPGSGWYWHIHYVSNGPHNTAHDAVVSGAGYVRDRNQADARSKNFPTVAERGVW